MNEFRVRIKNISEDPIAEPGGDLAHRVEFHIDSADGRLSEDWDGGMVRGEDLKRCSQLQEKESVDVSQPEGWEVHLPDRWQEAIVNLALDHSVSESA
jgi:hypothetical protein